MEGLRYYSQFGQDRFTDEVVFRGKRNGFFVEIGASDGLVYSNSLFFERYRGWAGVCVEPIPRRFEELRRNRSCDCVAGCVGARAGQASFSVMEGSDTLSGFRPWAQAGGAGVAETITAHVFTPDEIFSRAKGKPIDFCSIDTEGTEMEILEAIDFKKWRPGLLTVEDNGKKARMLLFMMRHGYRLIAWLGVDLVFADAELARTIPRSALPGMRAVVRRLWDGVSYRIMRKLGTRARARVES